MMDEQFSINDLPIECIDEILKWITDRVDRIYARFVCKMWCALIDRDCSSERYQIDLWRLNRNRLYYNAAGPDFSKIFSLFLNSQRKKTSFLFEAVDFQGSEQFWRTKGVSIISLNLNGYCTNIPFEEIVEHCSLLKTLTINSVTYNNKKLELKVLLENCIANRKQNFSVRSLYLKAILLVDVTTVSKLVGQVFLGVQKVFFEDFPKDQFNQADEVNALSTSFENLKFVTTLSNAKGTFIFEPSESGHVIVKMMSLSIDLDRIPITNISAYLSRYLCGLKHLNRLNLKSFFYSNYGLDDLHELIVNCPPLKSMDISMESTDSSLTSPLGKNNIENLRLSTQKISHYQTHINDAFLQSFENLKTFQCYKLTFSDFVKLLHNLPCLEDLRFYKGIVDNNSEQTISNRSLLKMRVPDVFLLETIAKYDFSNLKTLRIGRRKNSWLNNGITELDLLFRNIDEHLKRVNCPKLENLKLYFSMKGWRINQGEFTQWIMNILAFFPRLTTLLFVPEMDINSQRKELNEWVRFNEILKTILARYRRLRKIGSPSLESHNLKIISPSHIEDRFYASQSVLYIP